VREGFIVATVVGEEIGEVVVAAGVVRVEAQRLLVLGQWPRRGGPISARSWAKLTWAAGSSGMSGERGLVMSKSARNRILGDQAERFAGGFVIGSAAQCFLELSGSPRPPGQG